LDTIPATPSLTPLLPCCDISFSLTQEFKRLLREIVSKNKLSTTRVDAIKNLAAKNFHVSSQNSLLMNAISKTQKDGTPQHVSQGLGQ